MSWMDQLYKTYDNNVLKEQDSKNRMPPIAHINVNAQLELSIKKNGVLDDIHIIEKSDRLTLIPVTEASMSRSSSISPHPLCDTLSYIAGDFGCHCDTETSKINAEKKYAKYMENLKMWKESSYSHPKVDAIYQYLSQGKLIDDLIYFGIIHIDKDGKYCDEKIAGQSYKNVMVRFLILGSDAGKMGTWQDDTLINAYTDYYLSSQNGDKDICYCLGQERTICHTHPRGIIPANNNAKLISSNDTRGFTYRGRFQNAEQAFALSYEASQKIHNALSWLVRKEGVYVGSNDKRVFLCWSPKGIEMPNMFGDLGLKNNEEFTPTSYRKKLRKALSGYCGQFKDVDDSIIIMGLDAVTKGRLSMTYYQELGAHQFIDRLTHWGETCCWYYLKFNENKKPYFAVETPSLRRIVECAYGNEKENALIVNDKLMKDQVQILTQCMIENQMVPYSLVQALKDQASKLTVYKDNLIRERVLSTACAIISKYSQERKKKGGQSNMKLDVTNTDRSYLFGRLLAIYEKIEQLTYSSKESRMPNAIRLQQEFVMHPKQTWKQLEDSLNPYFQKLTPGAYAYFKNMIGDIMTLFDPKDIKKMNMGLSEEYLLGYYLQRAELSKKKNQEEENNG